MAILDWVFNQAGQWVTTSGPWMALVWRQDGTWSGMVLERARPAHRYEHGHFPDDSAARTWCEAEITRLLASTSGA